MKENKDREYKKCEFCGELFYRDELEKKLNDSNWARKRFCTAQHKRMHRLRKFGHYEEQT